MLFEKNKYYDYIKKLETNITISYVIIIALSLFIGIISKNFFTIIIYGLIGFGLANVYTLKTKILIQEMRWKLDIYEKITNNKDLV